MKLLPMILPLGTLLILASCASTPSGLRHPASKEVLRAPMPLSSQVELSRVPRRLQVTNGSCRCLPAQRRTDAPIFAGQGTYSVFTPRAFQEEFDVNLNVLSSVRRAYGNSSLVLSDYSSVVNTDDVVLTRKSFKIVTTHLSSVDSRPYRCQFEAELGQIDQTLKVTGPDGEVHYLNSRDEPSVTGLGKLTEAFGVQAYEGYEVSLEEDYIVEGENHRPARWRYNFEFKMTQLPEGGGYRCQLENHDSLLLPDPNV